MAKDPFIITWKREPANMSGPGYYWANVEIPNLNYPLTFTIDRELNIWTLSVSVTDREGAFFNFNFDRLDDAKRFAHGFMNLLKLVEM